MTGGAFPTTRGSMVERNAREPADAEDLAQAFFAAVLAADFFAEFDLEPPRFCSADGVQPPPHLSCSTQRGRSGQERCYLLLLHDARAVDATGGRATISSSRAAIARCSSTSWRRRAEPKRRSSQRRA